ncbi:MAG: hypothetical protein MPW14_06280 [Candidatus Manganitrophus sp.]|nr:MAG: hypothetical protein MPW14_06280 [Candidatus Manganitrophus sp.]
MPPSSSSGTCSVSRRSLSGSYSTTQGFAADHGVVQAQHRVGRQLAGLVHLGDDRRRRLDAPAHGLQDQLQLGGGQLGALLLQGAVDEVAEDVVVLEQCVAERHTQGGGHLDEAAVTLPGLGVEQLLALLLRQALLRADRPLSSSVSSSSLPQSARRWSNAPAMASEKSSKSASPNSSNSAARSSSSPEAKRRLSMAFSDSWLCRRSGRSTVTFQ